MQIAHAALKKLEFVAEDEMLRRLRSVNKEYLARPGGIGEITDCGHQGRDAYASADQDNAVSFLAREGEPAQRRQYLDEVAFGDFGVQVFRESTGLFLALNCRVDIGRLGCR
jgi:hypothetical protein